MKQLKQIADRCIEYKKELIPVLICFLLATIALFSLGKAEEPQEETDSIPVTSQQSEPEEPKEIIQKVKADADFPETATEIRRENWYVTTDEYSDRVGNLKTIFNFCAYNWENARQWLIDNYQPSWPYGKVKDSYVSKNWGKPVAMAIAISTIRESSSTPDQFQKMNDPNALSGPFGLTCSNQYVFDCLNNRLYDQGYGLISWTFACVDEFISFCSASGLNPRSLETQLYFMAYQYYANNEWYKRYSYLFPYEDVEPTLENIKEVSRIHTTCVCMGNRPDAQYPKVMNATYRIIDNWGSAKYRDLVASASGAYELLYKEAYHGDLLLNAETISAESSMYEGNDGNYDDASVPESAVIAEENTEDQELPIDEETESARQEELEGKIDPDATIDAPLESDTVTGASLEPELTSDEPVVPEKSMETTEIPVVKTTPESDS